MKKAVLLSFLLCLALACTACAGGDMQPSPTPDAATEAPQDANLPQLPEDIRVDQNGVPVLNVYVQSEDKIDEMGLEEYLCGVLAGEMKNDWPEEALKAQAILARTFVLKFLMEKKSMYEGADISTDIREAQAYDAEGVNERIRAAVKDTRGMVACYQNVPIYAWFHAHSGGKTDTAENGLDYQQAAPYTQVTDGNESESAPQDAAQWSTQFTEAEVIQAAADAGLKLDGGIETVQAQLPAVVSVTEKSNTPRSPKIRGKMAAKKAVFDVWKVEDLGLDAASVGKSGSATKVTELFAPEPNPVGVMIEGATPADVAANLVKELTAKNLL